MSATGSVSTAGSYGGRARGHNGPAGRQPRGTVADDVHPPHGGRGLRAARFAGQYAGPAAVRAARHSSRTRLTQGPVFRAAPDRGRDRGAAGCARGHQSPGRGSTRSGARSTNGSWRRPPSWPPKERRSRTGPCTACGCDGATRACGVWWTGGPQGCPCRVRGGAHSFTGDALSAGEGSGRGTAQLRGGHDRRSQARRPEAPFTPTMAARPGGVVQIDTTPLDELAVLDDGVTGRVELTLCKI